MVKPDNDVVFLCDHAPFLLPLYVLHALARLARRGQRSLFHRRLLPGDRAFR
jgi:hypothetical protein